MQSEFRFSCRACGKCCNGPPQLSVREMYEHLDDFVLSASIIVQPSKVPSSFEPTWRERVRLTIGRVIELGSMTFPARGQEMVATLSGVVLQEHHKRRCPVLASDNRCAIYDTRPNTCRYLPGAHLLPMDQQGMAFGDFRAQMRDNCDWSASSPLIYQDKHFVDAGMAEAFSRAEEDDRADASLLETLLRIGDEEPLLGEMVSIREAIDGALDSGETTLPVAIFTILLEGVRARAELPEFYVVPSAGIVARRQAEVCRRMIERNLREKDPTAQAQTEVLRDTLFINKQVEAAYATLRRRSPRPSR